MWLGFGGDLGAVRSMVLTERSWEIGSEESTYEVAGSTERTSWVVEIDYLAES